MKVYITKSYTCLFYLIVFTLQCHPGFTKPCVTWNSKTRTETYDGCSDLPLMLRNSVKAIRLLIKNYHGPLLDAFSIALVTKTSGHHSNLQFIVFKDSSFTQVDDLLFTDGIISDIIFDNVTFIKLSNEMFSHFGVRRRTTPKQITFINCTILQIDYKIFHKTSVESLMFDRCVLPKLNTNVFGKLDDVYKLTIKNSEIETLSPMIFGSQIAVTAEFNNLKIRNALYQSIPVDAGENTRVKLKNIKFNCSCAFAQTVDDLQFWLLKNMKKNLKYYSDSQELHDEYMEFSCYLPIQLIGVSMERATDNTIRKKLCSVCHKTFGHQCKYKCNCLNDVTCNNITGKCPGPCAWRYEGPSCQSTCPERMYNPPNCSEECHCLNPSKCSLDGRCTDGLCSARWTGPDCLITCTNYTFYDPPGCNGRCHCYEDEVCSVVNGSCPGKCHNRYYGPFCQQTCNYGFWGNNCSSKCFCNPEDTCNILSGQCLNGYCQLGSNCTHCYEEKYFEYGGQCRRCHCHKDENCTHGVCKNGCHKDWTGFLCQTPKRIITSTIRQTTAEEEDRDYTIVYVVIGLIPVLLLLILFCYCFWKWKKIRDEEKLGPQYIVREFTIPWYEYDVDVLPLEIPTPVRATKKRMKTDLHHLDFTDAVTVSKMNIHKSIKRTRVRRGEPLAKSATIF